MVGLVIVQSLGYGPGFVGCKFVWYDTFKDNVPQGYNIVLNPALW